MKLSVITINLNNKEGLKRTVTSVLTQTIYPTIEYLIIDGQSNDGSLEIIEQHADRISYWTSEQDNGVYDAMNKGSLRASGKYLLFLNSGDILADSSALERAVHELDGTDIIYGDICFDYGTHRERYLYPDQLSFRFFCERSLGHPATFIRRELFTNHGMYDLSYAIAADWVFFTRVICKHNASTKHLPLLLSIFDMSGMSNNPVNEARIAEERFRLLSSEFPLFFADYRTLKDTEEEVIRIKSSKAFQWLRALGVKKFRS